MVERVYRRPSMLKQIARDRHALIEASAGTGKTYIIQHLVLDLLLAGRSAIDQILVVTFTEKATAELRTRIHELLDNVARGAISAADGSDDEPVTIDEPARERLESALYSFDRAPIFTIHGFCNRVLSEFAFHCGTRLDLELTDGRGAFHRAFRAELRELLKTDAAATKLVEKWLQDNNRQKIEKLETLLFNAYRRRYLDSADYGLGIRAARSLIDSYDEKTLGKEYRKAPLKHQQVEDALSSLDLLGSEIDAAGGSPDALLNALPLDFACDAIVKPVLSPSAAQRNSDHNFSAQASEFAHAAAQLQWATSLAWRMVDRLLPPIVRRLERDKRERALLDYDDMLAWVWNALEGPGGAALTQALRERFHYALVDEFQDTDDLQWSIFKRIFVESGGKNLLYVVGDPRQSIYAFRGADVFTYLQAREELKAAGVSAVALVKNFRSTSRLIDACNHILDQNASQPIFNGAILYDHPVQCGRPDRKAVDRAGNELTPVILMRYQREDGEKASASEARAAIGRYIAGTLRQILFDGAHKIAIVEQGAKNREVSAKDVYVLTRTRQESVEIGEHLRAAGVPFAFYKQEGLFQTPEAYHVLNVLQAVAEPHLHSRRLKAWVTPFFGVAFRDLALMSQAPPTHPLHERLYQWKALAERGRLAELFDGLLHHSGLVDRELFLAGSERELTNYLHIFEVLLAGALAKRLALTEVIALLDDYIAERASPAGENGNIQRLETERDAVQIMTVHMSKGLEADVVVLYGGIGRLTLQPDLLIYHEGHDRHFAIGKSAREANRDVLSREEKDEDSRLLYVALTRARARVYLPLLPEDATRELTGYYKALNLRLREIAQKLAKPGRREEWSKLFAIEKVPELIQDASPPAGRSQNLASWLPPDNLLEDPPGIQPDFRELRRSHAPLIMRSYTTLSDFEQSGQWDIEPEQFKADLEISVDDHDLPGGRNVGIFLHEAIEKVDMTSLDESASLQAWRERQDVKGLFWAAMRRNQVRDPSWFERGSQAVWSALTSKIAIPHGRFLGPLCRRRCVREMEFVYPIPHPAHPLLGTSGNGKWTVENGYLKGFVDFVFEDQGRWYFADWKSDRLPSYEPGAIADHVKLHYEPQAKIYSLGVIRLLRISNETEYLERFGGLLYLFLRGMGTGDAGDRGVYFLRPQWTEICGYESSLMKTI